MLGPFTFTFTLQSEEFEKFEKVGCALDLYQTMISTRAPDGANNMKKTNKKTTTTMKMDNNKYEIQIIITPIQSQPTTSTFIPYDATTI